MKTIERPEGRPSPTVCARCGSQFSSFDEVETFCATCLLHTALIDEDAAHAARPHRFDQYELMTGDDGKPIELGRGAMGVTYKAFDTNLRYEVALKIIHPRYLADESSRARFLSEARAAAQLRHRNIASVFHLGSERDEYFYAMELVDGETVEEWVVRKGPLDCTTALEITLQITRALIATGGRRFVHRDIKPSNIMLCTEADGAIVAKLIDFGLVRAVADQTVTGNTAPTRDGFIGTPHFASPEQFTGQPTDARSDIYSLGVTLWFMLTGKAPFDGTRNDIQRQQLTGVLPLHQLKGIPRGVVDLIKRMLAVDPAKRPQSPGALKEQLNNCIGAIDVVKQKQRRRFAYSAMAATVIITGLLAASYIFQHKHVSDLTSEIVPEKSIAVLPFENLSEEKEHASFADGVQDEILTDLAQIADLKVISRTSVTHYKTGIAPNLAEIGRQLGVAHVVEGNVHHTGNHMHVYAQLLDVRTNRRLWQQTYDGDLSDVFAIHSEIARAIANQLQITLSPIEKNAIERQPTTNVTAFDLYTRAKNLVVKEGIDNSKAILLPAIDLLDQAIARDPTFLDAYCLVAWAHDLLYFVGDDHTPARLALAEAAIEGASRLHPEAGQTHLARAWNLHWGHLDYNGALAELEIAHRSLPNDEQIPRLAGYIYRRQGRWEDSARSLERAIELDPRNVGTLQQIALSYGHLSRYAEEEQALDRVLAIEPNDIATRLERAGIEMDWRADTRPLHQAIDSVRATNPAALPTVADSWLICALAERDVAAANQALIACSPEEAPLSNQAIHFSRPFIQGVIARMKKEDDKARAAFTAARVEQEKIIQAQPDYGPALCVLGLIDAALGRKEQALNEGHRAVELLPVEKDALDGPLMIKYLAMIAAWAGDKDLACDQLSVAVHSPSGPSYGAVKLLPWWDPLRGDPRFERIVASLAPGASEVVPDKSIAVLPFANLSNDREDASFVDGVQDDILTKLARIADLKVISRSSVMQYRDQHNTREIGDALGVSLLLEGSIRKTGSWLHINAQLIDARTDTHVWAEEYDRDLKEMFAVQSDIAQKVAEHLHAKISAAERLAIERPPTIDLTAFDFYSRAKNLLLMPGFSSSAIANVTNAIALLNQAVEHDPSFIQAYCQLAHAHHVFYFLGFDHTPARLALANEAIKAAFRLRPEAGEAHLAQAEHLYRGYLDYNGALAELEIAGQTLPNDARLFELKAYIERRQGKQEQALTNLQRGLELDPRNLFMLQQTALSYDDLGRYRDEKALLNRALAIEPDDVDTRLMRALVEFSWKADTQPLHRLIDAIQTTTPAAVENIGDAWIICALAERDAPAAKNALVKLGNAPLNDDVVQFNREFLHGVTARMIGNGAEAQSAFDAARAEQEKVINAQPNYGPPLCVLGLIDAAQGRKEEALQEGRRAVDLLTVEKDAINGPRMIKYFAMIAAWVGEKDLACEQLAAAIRYPGLNLSYGQLKLMPWWDPLRGDPRFEKIVASLAPK